MTKNRRKRRIWNLNLQRKFLILLRLKGKIWKRFFQWRLIFTARAKPTKPSLIRLSQSIWPHLLLCANMWKRDNFGLTLRKMLVQRNRWGNGRGFLLTRAWRGRVCPFYRRTKQNLSLFPTGGFGVWCSKKTKLKIAIKWLNHAEFIISEEFFVGQGLAPAEQIQSMYYFKNDKGIVPLPFLAFFAFCSGAVPSYSSRSQNAKFSSFSHQSLQIL